LLDSECHNLGLLIKMTNLHQHLHYGHPIHNRNIGHDNLNTVGYQGSDIIHAAEAMGPITIQGAERNNVHVETKKVPSTINGTERRHDDKDSSMDAANQPYKKMRSSIHHSNTSVSANVETKKVPSTINGTERSHDDKDSSMDAANQPYKKMRSSIHHSNTSVSANVETKKVPSTINGTERSHDNRDSSMDAADQPYKKMRSSIHHSYTSVATFQVSDHSNPSMSSLRHHSTVSQSLLQGPGEMHELPSIRERVNNAEEAVPEISDPYNIPMN
jgi:hypothetical protein